MEAKNYRGKKSLISLSFIALMLGAWNNVMGASAFNNDMSISLVDSSINVNSIEYLASGAKGVNSIWDFRYVKNIGNSNTLTCIKDTLNQYIVAFDDRQWLLECQADTLRLLQEMSPMYHIVYNGLHFILPNTLDYASSDSGVYKGMGNYYGDHPYKETGTYWLETDAKGSILYASDTLRHITRIHAIKACSKAMSITPMSLDSADTRQAIEEVYAWFIRGVRFPVFVSVTNTSYQNLTPIGVIKKYYCSLPDIQSSAFDALRDKITEQDSTHAISSQKASIDYTYKLNNKRLAVSCNALTDAEVTMLVSDLHGVIYSKISFLLDKGQQETKTFDLDNLYPGQYVLYVHANDNVYNSKFAIKR